MGSPERARMRNTVTISRSPNETLQLSGARPKEVVVATALAHTVCNPHLPGAHIARS